VQSLTTCFGDILKTGLRSVFNLDRKMTLKIGEWTIQPDNDRIVNRSEKKVLRPQVMDILVYLAARPDKTVSAENLLEALWPSKVVTQSTLYNAINELRQVLGDDTKNPKYIQTVPKRGYRLIAKVSRTEQPAAATVMASHAAFEPKPDRRLNLVNSIALLGILVLMTWYILKMEPGSAPPTGLTGNGSPVRSVAILPFVELSPGGDQEYFAQGISEEIINVISAHPDLRVVGRNSSFMFRDQDIDLNRIGRQLGVSYILQGSV